MKERLEAARAAAMARLRPALAWVNAHLFWVECGAVALFGVLAAFSLGYSALSRTRTLEARMADLERAESSLDRWRREIQPPAAQESLSWRESERSVRSLGGDAARALSVARLVARRAEEVGITGLRVQLLGQDSMVAIETMESAGWVVEPAGEGLAVEFDGDIGAVIGLLGALPPQAALASLVMGPQGDALRARMVLVTRHAVPR